MLSPWKSCLNARLQWGKMHSARMVKYQRNAPKGLGTPLKEFVDPQCEPSVNSVDPMEVEGLASSRARLVVNKWKGLASSVHIFRGICKKPRKKHSPMQEMSDSLKSMSDIIVESRSVSIHTPFCTTEE